MENTIVMKQFVFLVCCFLLLTVQSTRVAAQASAPAPTPSAKFNITAILEKAGQFTTLIRLMKSTQVADQIDSQLGTGSNQGLTIFAPTDNAFNNLKTGTLNSLSDQEKVQLIQFHILPSLVSQSQFQTVSNPLRTQIGNDEDYQLNVTTGGNQVNVTTGVNTATVDNTIYTGSQLVVYQVSQVLLPKALFGTSPSPAPAPAPAKAEKGVPVASDAPTASSNKIPADSSDAVACRMMVPVYYVFGVVLAILAF